MIVVFAHTGLRFKELSYLRERSIISKNGGRFICIKKRSAFIPKDPTEIKYIPMSKEVCEIINSRINQAQGGYLFTNTRGNPVPNNKSLVKLKSLFEDADISLNERRLHWHSWRRFFVKKCMERGVSLNVLMSWTGHDTVKMALSYAPATFIDSMKELKKISA